MAARRGYERPSPRNFVPRPLSLRGFRGHGCHVMDRELSFPTSGGGSCREGSRRHAWDTKNLLMKHRVRIRFGKTGDLRWISHRDLARAFERLFRRSGLELGMSEGFHPKAKLSFPSALALGIGGQDELLDIELAEELPEDEVAQRLRSSAVPGLEIHTVKRLDEKTRKARVERLTYEVPVPPLRRAKARQAITHLLGQTSHLVERAGRNDPIDVRAGLELLEMTETALRFCLSVGSKVSVRPREVLIALGLSDLEDEGFYLTRTAVEISPPSEQESTTLHEEGNAD